MKPTRTLHDGTRIYGVHVRIEIDEHSYPLLAKLFPKGVTLKDALGRALQWLFVHEQQGLRGEEHLLTEAFHAQTRNVYRPELLAADPPTPDVHLTRQMVHEASRNTLRQLLQQDPGAVGSAFAELLGDVMHSHQQRETRGREKKAS